MSAAPSRAGALLAVAGGLVLAAAGASGWLRTDTTREVGGVPVPQAVVENGTEFAPLLLPLGLALLLAGAVALAVRGQARRALQWLIIALSAAALAATVAGLLRTRHGDGQVTAAPWLAGVAAVVTLGGGVRGLVGRPAAPAPPALDVRYTVEGAEAGDDEWRLAADDDGEAV